MKQKDGAKIIIMSPDKILLFHRDNIPTINSPDCWCLVGGGIEEGETPEEALIREVKEETSFNLQKYKLLTKFTGSMGEDVWLYVALVEKNEESKFILGPGEGQAIAWFTLDEAIALKLTSGAKMLLSKYQDLLAKIMKTKIIPTI